MLARSAAALTRSPPAAARRRRAKQAAAGNAGRFRVLLRATVCTSLPLCCVLRFFNTAARCQYRAATRAMARASRRPASPARPLSLLRLFGAAAARRGAAELLAATGKKGVTRQREKERWRRVSRLRRRGGQHHLPLAWLRRRRQTACCISAARARQRSRTGKRCLCLCAVLQKPCCIATGSARYSPRAGAGDGACGLRSVAARGACRRRRQPPEGVVRYGARHARAAAWQRLRKIYFTHAFGAPLGANRRVSVGTIRAIWRSIRRANSGILAKNIDLSILCNNRTITAQNAGFCWRACARQ